MRALPHCRFVLPPQRSLTLFLGSSWRVRRDDHQLHYPPDDQHFAMPVHAFKSITRSPSQSGNGCSPRPPTCPVVHRACGAVP